MKAIIISSIISALSGAIYMDWVYSQEIGQLTRDKTYYQKENARYTNTVEGLVAHGWTEERIAQYIEKGCVPYLEYVRGNK